jgi:hypothetical protein
LKEDNRLLLQKQQHRLQKVFKFFKEFLHTKKIIFLAVTTAPTPSPNAYADVETKLEISVK